MRMMVRAQFPVEKSNEAIKNGKLPEVIKKITDKWKPEAAYFFTRDGMRTCVMVFNMTDTSQIPVIAEPFFMELNAAVDFTPVMNADDLMKGLSEAFK